MESNFDLPNKTPEGEKPWLTDTEVATLLERLEKEARESMAKFSEDYDYDKLTQKTIEKDTNLGYVRAEDRYDRDVLEEISKFLRIDFEKLRKMSPHKVDLLADEFKTKSPESEILPPPDFRVEQDQDNLAEEIKKAGGAMQYFLKRAQEKGKKPPGDINLPDDRSK